ncbi:hypothetical protein D3C76_1521920 [compost metagenome]
MDPIEAIVEAMKHGVSSTISKALRGLLRIISKHHISTADRFIEHIRDKANVIGQRIDNDNEITKRILQPNPRGGIRIYLFGQGIHL